MRVAAWLISCCVVGAGPLVAGVAQADCAEVRWSVVGLASEERSAMGERVALVRAALEAELKRVGSDDTLTAEEIGRRLGLQLHGPSYAEAQIEAAELFYFQFEFSSAEESLLKAIETLASRADPRAANRSRAARYLLGAVHLEVGGPEAKALASAAIEPMVRAAPEHRPDPRAYPEELIQLFDELRNEQARQPKGSLRVRREDGGAGHVWADAQPLGPVGSEIRLPPGRYRILVGDSLANPSRLSFLHEVDVRPGEESSLWLDLRWGSSADPGDGPSFAWVEERTRVVAASRLAAQLGPAPLVLVWEEDGALHAAVYDPAEGELIREASAQLGATDREGIYAALAATLVGGSGATSQGGLAMGSAVSSDDDGSTAAAGAAAPQEALPAGARAKVPEAEPARANEALDSRSSVTAGADELRRDRAGEERRAAAGEVRDLELRLDERLRVDDTGRSPPWIEPTKWATAGIAVVAAAIGFWMHADAASQQRELDSWARERGGVAASAEEARAASERSSSIRSQAQTGTAVLIGAGAAGVSSLVLFLMDD